MPLIASRIMSKKLAAGSKNIVPDERRQRRLHENAWQGKLLAETKMEIGKLPYADGGRPHEYGHSAGNAVCNALRF